MLKGTFWEKNTKKPVPCNEQSKNHLAPYITECRGCNHNITLYGNFCLSHTLKINGCSFAVPCSILTQTHQVQGEHLDGFICSLCSVAIDTETTNASIISDKHIQTTKTNDFNSGDSTDVNEMHAHNNPEIKIAETSVLENEAKLANTLTETSNFDMKLFAHELIDLLPYEGWTVAFTPGNTIQLFLDWSDDEDYIKKITLFESKVEIEIHKIITETITNMSMNIVNIQALCGRVVQMKVCTGLTDPEIVAFCQQEQLKPGFDANENGYFLCKEQGKLAVRSTTCTHTKERNNFSHTDHCSECQKLWRHRIRAKPGFKSLQDCDQLNPRLSSLSYEQLLQRCQLLKKKVKTQKKTNQRLLKEYKAFNKKSSKIPVPNNFNPTSSSLGKSVDFALDQKWLSENSVLFAFIQDTIIALKKKEENNGKPSPGMRCSPLVIKWCVDLAEKCKHRGYEAIRKIIPIPHIRTIQSYRNHSNSFKEIEEENLQIMVQEMNRRNCQGLGGIHWDEIYIKDGIKVNVRTNQLIEFEELAINDDLLTGNMYDEITEQQFADFNEKKNVTAEGSKQEKAKMILQFFWTSLSGVFSWPVASFPISNMNCMKLTECVWRVVESLSKLKVSSKLERLHTVYGVCDGASYSSAFCNRAGSKNYVTENPHHSGVPIYWLSDPPHMLKKLRNHVLSPKRNLQQGDRHIKFEHFLDVAERGMANLHYKHIYLDHRSKMNVKKASQFLSTEVADDLMKNSSLDLYETSLTRQYIKQCQKYFKIMNSLKIEQGDLQQLFSILCWFRKWKKEIKDEYKQTNDADNWTKFTPLTTYRDLKRSIRGFCAVYLYTTLYFPDINFVPRTTNQDDVENYFSLQRGRYPGELTVEKYMLNNTAISTSMLIKAENTELTDQMGSYNEACLPNFVAKPLERMKSDGTRKQIKLWTPDEAMIEHEVVDIKEQPYSLKDEKIMWDQLSCIFEHLNAQSPKVIIAYVHKVLLKLQEEHKRSSVLAYFHNIDEKVRHLFFKQGSWSKDSLIAAENYIRADRHVREKWIDMLLKFMLPANEKVQDSIALLGMIVVKFLRRRCVFIYKKINSLLPMPKQLLH